MYFKILGSVMIITASTYTGFYLGSKLIKRINELTELERLGTLLENEIVYSHTPLPQAIFSISSRQGNNIEKLFYKMYEKLSMNETDSIFDAVNLAVNENLRQLCTEKDDLKILLDLAKSLGDYDIEGYKKVFALYKIGIKNKISEAESKKNKNIKMYRYLGFSIGAAAVIMII
ncbi:MAG: stage III sporulation protein AB [Bacillota bacterium]|nr:stage III sporulation protein AB [Bacillota bacterium]